MTTNLTSIPVAGKRLMAATVCAAVLLALLLSGCARPGPTTGHYDKDKETRRQHDASTRTLEF